VYRHDHEASDEPEIVEKYDSFRACVAVFHKFHNLSQLLTTNY
jgi:hypothetical protein